MQEGEGKGEGNHVNLSVFEGGVKSDVSAGLNNW